MVQPGVTAEEARKIHGDNIRTINLPSGKTYLRMVPQPADSASQN